MNNVVTLAIHYPLGTTVRIKAINVDAIVTGVIMETCGLSYRCAYWNNSERKTEWLMLDEIEGKP